MTSRSVRFLPSGWIEDDRVPKFNPTLPVDSQKRLAYRRVVSAMPLPTHLQNHIVVAYLGLRDLVDEMESIATRGIASSGTGRRMTPLPSGEWERMEPRLRQI